MTDYTDLIERLLTESENSPWDALMDEAAIAIQSQSKRIAELEARLEFNPEAPEIDGIYCRDETIRLQEVRIAELESELETERMRLAACGVVAMSNTKESAKQARDMIPAGRWNGRVCLTTNLLGHLCPW